MELGMLLKESRAERGVSQRLIADKLGISRSYYSDLENGRYLPSYRLLMKLNDEFDFFYFASIDGNTIQIRGERGLPNEPDKTNGTITG